MRTGGFGLRTGPTASALTHGFRQARLHDGRRAGVGGFARERWAECSLEPIERYLGSVVGKRGGERPADHRVSARCSCAVDGQTGADPGEARARPGPTSRSSVLGVLDRGPQGRSSAREREGRLLVSRYNRVAPPSASTATSRWARARNVHAHDPAEAPDLRGGSGSRRRWSTSRNLPQGLVLVTGPTGFGEVDVARRDHRLQFNRTRHCHIITIEDPVEYVHNHKTSAVSQRRGSATTRTRSPRGRCGPRSARGPRRHPRGREMRRSRGPCSSRLSIAETGHLVFANSAHETTHRKSLDRHLRHVSRPSVRNQIRVQLAGVPRGA